MKSRARTRLSIEKGLDIPVAGAPEQVVDRAARCTSVGLVAADAIGLRASVLVREGERVRLGQPLFEDRRNAGVRFTSPATGVVSAIHRGARRALQSIVVDVEDFGDFGDGGHCGTDVEHPAGVPVDDPASLAAEAVTETLLASGLWTALRTRPYGRIPPPGTRPSAIFVAAVDTNPLAPDPGVVIAADHEAFSHGLGVLAQLTSGELFVGVRPGAPRFGGARVRRIEVTGPHPAGLVGTLIHFLAPVGPKRTVWYLGYQDVIAIGKLFSTGRVFVDRVVALAGPVVNKPRLVRTRLGAAIDDIVRDELEDTPRRIVSGSVLSGRTSAAPSGFVGRYHDQVSVLSDEPGGAAYSVHAARRPALPARAKQVSTTASHGGLGPMLPLDTFDRVMPLDILATPLLRALLVGDVDAARSLGCLELEEEDLALCSFVCPGKNDYGALLRAVLEEIERGS